MNNDIHLEPPASELPEAGREAATIAADAAKETVKKAGGSARDVTGDVGDMAAEGAPGSAADKARHIYCSAKSKVGESLERSSEYVHRNPLPVILGAIAFGAGVGCMLTMAWHKLTFRERYADEPVAAVREALIGAFAPVSQRVHDGYDSARNGAGKAMDRVRHFGRKHSGESFSDKICRFGNNLKFW